MYSKIFTNKWVIKHGLSENSHSQTNQLSNAVNGSIISITQTFHALKTTTITDTNNDAFLKV